MENIKEFNTDIVRKEGGATIVLYGTRGSGKSHATYHLLHQLMPKRKYTSAFLFSETAKTQEGNFPMIPPVFKFEDLDNLGEVIDRQKQLIAYNKKMEKKGTKKRMKRSAIAIIIDDMVSDRTIRKNTDINRLFTLGRHISHKATGSLIDVFILTQYAKAIPPILRQNTDVAILFRQDGYDQRKVLVGEYLTVGSTYREGYDFFNHINDIPFGALAIHATRSNKKKLEDYVYKFVAPEKIPTFRIGMKKYWEET